MSTTVVLAVTDTTEAERGSSNVTNNTEFRQTTGAVPQYEFVTYILIGTLGVTGNGFVLIVLFSAKRLRQKVVNMFLINQSLVDFVTSVILIASANNDRSSGGHYGITGEMFCRFWVFKIPLWAVFTSSTYNLVAVTLERYLAVCRPIQHKLAVTPTRTVPVIILIWLLGPVEHFTLNGFINDARDGHCFQSVNWPEPWVKQMVGILTICIEFFIPLAIMIIAYSLMIKSIRARVAPSAGDCTNNDSATNRKLEKSRRIQNNILRTLVLVCACFFLCWVWNQIYFLLFNLHIHANFRSPFYHFTVYAAFINCMINPIVYAAQYKDFQNQVMKLFSCKSNTSIDDAPTKSTAGVAD